MSVLIGVGVLSLHVFDCGHDIEVLNIAESEAFAMVQAEECFDECPICAEIGE